MKPFLKIFSKSSKAAGVHIQCHQDNVFELSVCILEIKKGVVTLIDRKEKITLNELPHLIPKNCPVQLAIDGKGILTRKITGSSLANEEHVLREIIPNAKTSDFYLRSYKTTDFSFLSLIRTGQLDEIIDSLSSSGLSVIDVHLGPFVVSSLLPFISANDQSLQFGYGTIHFQNGVIEEVTSAASEQQNYKVGDDLISSTLLVAYSAALSFFIENDALQKWGAWQKVKEERSNWEQKEIFRKASVGAGIFFFSVLFINAMVYFNLYTENQELSEDQGMNRKLVKELATLKQDVERNRDLIKTAGWIKKPPVWFYADRLAASVPEGISLTTLNVFPVDEKVLSDLKKTVFRSSRIHISGTCTRPLTLNQWLGSLKSLDWISSITDQTYKYVDREKNGYFDFVILLKE